ncbi:hypothetical protein [Microbacterium atlanticum]|uniref:hypothetical protein n=1 Tax=Microbacterium atlanticum TaxID=2782168 RepID=UPI00188922E7|nr:hypothetical protein [Microbacterium atlanticum]
MRENVWRPWDADDEEYAHRLTVREMLPAHARAAVENWLGARLANAGYGFTSAALRNYIETALHFKFAYDPGDVRAQALVGSILDEGDRFTVRVIDLLVSGMERDHMYRPPSAIVELAGYLDLAASSITIVDDDRSFRIGRRLPDGVERIASEAAAAAGEVAGRHLATAWAAATALEPDPSKAMTEAIRGVEAAAGPVVIPRDGRPQLGKIVRAIRDKPDITLIFETRDDGHPDLRQVLIGMLETLAFAQRDRHSGEAPEPITAIGHVQLASTLVSWFSTGVVRYND